MIALFLLTGLSPEWSARWVSVLAGAATVIPLFFIGRRLGGTRCGWLAAFMLTLLSA